MSKTWADYGITFESKASDESASVFWETKSPNLIYFAVLVDELEEGLTLQLRDDKYFIELPDLYFSQDDLAVFDGDPTKIKAQLDTFLQNMVSKLQTDSNQNRTNNPTVGSAWGAAGVEDERFSKEHKKERRGKY